MFLKITNHWVIILCIVTSTLSAGVTYVYSKRTEAELVLTSAYSSLAYNTKLLQLMDNNKYDQVMKLLEFPICGYADLIKSTDAKEYERVTAILHVKKFTENCHQESFKKPSS